MEQNQNPLGLDDLNLLKLLSDKDQGEYNLKIKNTTYSVSINGHPNFKGRSIILIDKKKKIVVCDIRHKIDWKTGKEKFKIYYNPIKQDTKGGKFGQVNKFEVYKFSRYGTVIESLECC